MSRRPTKRNAPRKPKKTNRNKHMQLIAGRMIVLLVIGFCALVGLLIGKPIIAKGAAFGAVVFLINWAMDMGVRR